MNHLALACLVGARRVDRPPFLLASVSADGIEMLQGKSERIDHAVARLARLGFGLQRHALAGRQVRVEIGRERGDGLGRRPEHPAQARFEQRKRRDGSAS